MLHLRRTNHEKENEIKCKKEEVKRKEAEVEEMEERIQRGEEEVEEETSCCIYNINELKK